MVTKAITGGYRKRIRLLWAHQMSHTKVHWHMCVCVFCVQRRRAGGIANSRWSTTICCHLVHRLYWIANEHCIVCIALEHTYIHTVIMPSISFYMNSTGIIETLPRSVFPWVIWFLYVSHFFSFCSLWRNPSKQIPSSVHIRKRRQCGLGFWVGGVIHKTDMRSLYMSVCLFTRASGLWMCAAPSLRYHPLEYVIAIVWWH